MTMMSCASVKFIAFPSAPTGMIMSRLVDATCTCNLGYSQRNGQLPRLTNRAISMILLLCTL